MAKSKAPAKPTSGGARLKASGKLPMLLGWEPADRELIERAAAAEGRSMANFVYRKALEAAKSILRKEE